MTTPNSILLSSGRLLLLAASIAFLAADHADAQSRAVDRTPVLNSAVRLTVQPTAVTVGDTVTFAVVSDAPRTTVFEYVFGDGSVQRTTSRRLIYVYAEPGTYRTSARIFTTDDVTVSSAEVPVAVSPRPAGPRAPVVTTPPVLSRPPIVTQPDVQPSIQLQADRTRITVGESVHFTAGIGVRAAAASAGAYAFSFGDGASERARLPEVDHVYDRPGSYGAFVQLLGAQGPVAQSPIVRIEVVPISRPRIALTADRPRVNAGEVVTFTIRTEDVSGPVLYEIAFGDGTQQRSRSQNVSHVYREPGTYRVLARIVGEAGFIAESNAVTITVRPERPVVLQLAAEPRRITEGESVRFRASMDRRVAASGYAFSFGDGAVERTPVPTISHVYRRSGTYSASVQLVGNEGVLAQSTAVPIVVEAAAPLSLALSVDRSRPDVEDRIRFTARLSADRPPGADYIFSFGDGGQRLSTIAQTEYAYSEPGTYRANVRLEAGGETLAISAPVEIFVPTPQVDPDGGQDSLPPDTSSESTPITDGFESEDTTNADRGYVDEPRFPIVTVRAEPGTLRRGRPVILSAIVEPDTFDLEFRFRYGDGSMSDWMTVREAQYAYAQAGSYNATVEARFAQTQELLASTATVLVHVVSRQIPLWVYLVGVVLAVLLVGFVLTRHRSNGASPPRDKPDRLPAEALLLVAAHADTGWAEVQAPVRIEWEVRIRPIPDEGGHHISSAADLTLSERRSDGRET